METDPLELVGEYLDFVDDHIVRPIRDTELKESCFASFLLLCGAMDGLGWLVAGPDVRFKQSKRRFLAFLGWMPDEYQEPRVADSLWSLRRSLAHEGLNTGAFLSKLEATGTEHLSLHGNRLFVNTGRLLADFTKSLERLRIRTTEDAQLLGQMADRLEEVCEDPRLCSEAQWSTPPPPLRLRIVQLRTEM